MLRHVVLFRWTSDAGEAEQEAVVRALTALADQVDSLRAYRFGPDVRLNDGNWDFAVTADFDDQQGYLGYRDHPAHREVIAETITPIVRERVAVQFEFEA